MKNLVLILALFSLNTFAKEQVTTTVRSVMASEGGGLIIFLNENVHTCSHKNRVAIRADDMDFKNQALSIALAAKASGEKVTLFLKDDCQEFGQKNLHGIVFGDFAYW